MALIDPPMAVEFIKEPFWAAHEAAFMLTDTWPSKITLNNFSAMPANLGRKYLYLPATSDGSSLQPEELGKKFSELFTEITTAIHRGVLPVHFAPIWNNIVFFVTPRDIIFWALIQRKVLPKSLQLALHFRHMKPKVQIDPYHIKIRTKIIAQIILESKPYLKDNIAKMLDEPLMKSIGTLSVSTINFSYPPQKRDDLPPRNNKSIRDDINTLFEGSGKPGRRSKNKIYNRPYKPIAVPEVLQIDEKGIPYYYFPLFVEAILLITRVKLYNSPNSNLSNDLLLNEIIADPIMKLYLNRSPDIIKKLVERLIMTEIIGLQENLKCMHLPIF